MQTHRIDGSAPCRQGEIYFRLVAGVPAGCTPAPAEGGRIIVGHSETGHHHAISDKLGVVHHRSENPLVSYLEVGPGVEADLEHLRPFDTHDTFRFEGGGAGRVWQAIRAREQSPEGWRAVAD